MLLITWLGPWCVLEGADNGHELSSRWNTNNAVEHWADDDMTSSLKSVSWSCRLVFAWSVLHIQYLISVWLIWLMLVFGPFFRLFPVFKVSYHFWRWTPFCLHYLTNFEAVSIICLLCIIWVIGTVSVSAELNLINFPAVEYQDFIKI